MITTGTRYAMAILPGPPPAFTMLQVGLASTTTTGREHRRWAAVPKRHCHVIRPWARGHGRRLLPEKRRAIHRGRRRKTWGRPKCDGGRGGQVGGRTLIRPWARHPSSFLWRAGRRKTRRMTTERRRHQRPMTILHDIVIPRPWGTTRGPTLASAFIPLRMREKRKRRRRRRWLWIRPESTRSERK